ncbi:unnamed protein product, partial [Sphenostylis stenocarpa]
MSSSNPTSASPGPSSTVGSTPLVANVGGSTQSPPPIVGSTPPAYQSTPSPIIASNASTPTEPVAASPSTHILGTHSTSAINHNHVQDEENVLHSEEEVPSVGDRPMIRP